MRRTALRLRPIPSAAFAVLLLALALAQGCQRVAPIRTLPSWVRGVYVPMIKNATFEPQLEEAATRLVQEAFLADGRVDVVPKDQADLVLIVELLDWTGETVRTRGDYIARTVEVTLTYSIKLYDPFDLQTPMADLGRFIITSGFNTDTRSNRYEPEPDRKENMLRRLGDQIVFQVLSGFPAAGTMPAGVAGGPVLRTPETIPVEAPLQDRPGQDAAPPLPAMPTMP